MYKLSRNKFHELYRKGFNMHSNTNKRKRRRKKTYWRYWEKVVSSIVTSPTFLRATKYIIALLFIIVYSKTFYVHSKIIRVGHHYFAPFTLIDSNKRLMWRGSHCVQNLTDQASAQQCVGACVLNKNCTTINYHREKKICELLNMSKFDTVGILLYQPGWTHYETDDDARLMGPTCYQLKPCKDYEVCEDTFTPKLYTCKCQDYFSGAECNNYIGPGSNQSVSAPACSLLMKRYKNISDGEYWIQGKNGKAVRKNCTRRMKNGKENIRPFPTAISSTATTSVTTTKATPCKKEDTSFWGKFTILPACSWQKCSQICKRWSDCKVWAYTPSTKNCVLGVHFDRFMAGRQISGRSSCIDTTPCSTPISNVFPSDIDGGGWIPVRHLPPGDKWFKATDRLSGTAEYGSSCDKYCGSYCGIHCATEWSIPFRDFNQFLFATGDGTKWLIANKSEVIGAWYYNDQRWVEKSSFKDYPYQVKWYRRYGSPEDPWISVTDHDKAVTNGDMLYGGNNYRGHNKFLAKQGGANVFIRTI